MDEHSIHAIRMLLSLMQAAINEPHQLELWEDVGHRMVVEGRMIQEKSQVEQAR